MIEINREFMEAYARLERERNHKGCGCVNCAKMAVKRFNNIIDDIFPFPEEANAAYYWIVPAPIGVKIMTAIEYKAYKSRLNQRKTISYPLDHEDDREAV